MSLQTTVDALYDLFFAVTGKTPKTKSGTADSGTTRTLVDATLTQESGHWNYTVITLTSGTNDGEKRVVYAYDKDTATLSWREALPAAVVDGDTYSMTLEPLVSAKVRRGPQFGTIPQTRVHVAMAERTEDMIVGTGAQQGALREQCEVDIGLELELADTAANQESAYDFAEQAKRLLRENRSLPSGKAQHGQITKVDYSVAEYKPGLLSRLITITVRYAAQV